MSFLFKTKSKSPAELVKSVKEALERPEGERKEKFNEELSKNILGMKNILYGEGGKLE